MPKNMTGKAVAAVPASAATEDDADVQLGSRLRSIRQSRRLSLKEVSHRSGLSLGLISQIERAISSPSIKALRSICEALDVPVSALFSDDGIEFENERGLIVRHSARRRLDFNHKGMVKELLTADAAGGIQLMEVILEPGAGSGDQPYDHQGDEAGVVLKGRVTLWIDERRYNLEEGDAFRFSSERPHRFQNSGRGEARILWAVTPPLY
ncbi:MAG: cupin domain-containing protein [Caenispirillum sp.]|nr:cupin domain-containing protein [Caenispirillum sp.]